MARIAVFGGSFDPPHHGHTHLVLSLQETHHIDEVLIIPAQVNPLKSPVASSEHRLAMCHLHFDAVPGCTVIEWEVHRPSPSYTIDTLRYLMEHHTGFAQAERFLFLGADVIPSLPLWKQASEVFSIARPLVAARGSVEPALLSMLSPQLVQAVCDGWNDTGRFDISSTMIRNRFQNGLYVNHLVHHAVFEYIRQEQIYLSSVEDHRNP